MRFATPQFKKRKFCKDLLYLGYIFVSRFPAERLVPHMQEQTIVKFWRSNRAQLRTVYLLTLHRFDGYAVRKNIQRSYFRDSGDGNTVDQHFLLTFWIHAGFTGAVKSNMIVGKVQSTVQGFMSCFTPAAWNICPISYENTAPRKDLTRIFSQCFKSSPPPH